jgi:hypothetical protein
MKRRECMQVNPQEYKALLLVVTAVLALLVASPGLQRLLVQPRTEFFTEVWLLGPQHKAQDYPFNITSGQNYGVYLGIGNNLGQCAYYVVEVKFRNESMSAPDSLNMKPSNLPSLFNMTVFVADNGVWEQSLTLSYDYGFNENMSKIQFHSMTLDGVTLDLHGLSSQWNATTSVFYGNLVFELWLFNGATNRFGYHERYVDLKLNMTA